MLLKNRNFLNTDNLKYKVFFMFKLIICICYSTPIEKKFKGFMKNKLRNIFLGYFIK